MKLYKCLDQTIDLEHVRAISDIHPHHYYFGVTLALTDKPLMFYLSDTVRTPQQLAIARSELLEAWKNANEAAPENVAEEDGEEHEASDFFRQYGRYLVRSTFYECSGDFTVEELYQAFHARLKSEGLK